LLDALADLDLRSQVANFGDLAAVHDAHAYLFRFPQNDI
jgi:hypothetical protein